MFVISRIYDWLAGQAEKSEDECRWVELSLLEENADARLLDLGCGDGKLTLKAAERIGTKKIHGIEIVDEDVERARVNGIDVRHGDLNQRLPFEDNTFDVILVSHVIEHLSNTDTFVKEVHRVLKLGGYSVIATPNLAAFVRILFLLFGKLPPGTDVSDEFHFGGIYSKAQQRDSPGPGHRRIFTLGALKELLEYYGFKVERVMGIGFFPLPNPLARIMSHIDRRHATDIVMKARKASK
jgi:methionine biosynthesis protein MetW